MKIVREQFPKLTSKELDANIKKANELMIVMMEAGRENDAKNMQLISIALMKDIKIKVDNTQVKSAAQAMLKGRI